MAGDSPEDWREAAAYIGKAISGGTILVECGIEMAGGHCPRTRSVQLNGNDQAVGGLDTVIKLRRQGATEYFGVPWEGAM